MVEMRERICTHWRGLMEHSGDTLSMRVSVYVYIYTHAETLLERVLISVYASRRISVSESVAIPPHIGYPVLHPQR
jgi:hypothetical protein